jgi:hypothetical protein
LAQGEDDLRFRELFLHPELLSECPILSKKLHPEWTEIWGSGQESLALCVISGWKIYARASTMITDRSGKSLSCNNHCDLHDSQGIA